MAPTKRKATGSAGDGNAKRPKRSEVTGKKDVEIFKDHWRKATKKTGTFVPRTTVRNAEDQWYQLSKDERSAEIQRIKQAVRDGVSLEDLELIHADNEEAEAAQAHDAVSNTAAEGLVHIDETEEGTGYGSETSDNSNVSESGPSGRPVEVDDDRRISSGRRETAMLAYGRENGPDHDNITWKLAKELGNGAFGAAYLWVAHDDKERVVARIAVKDSWASPLYWGGIRFWHGDVRDPEKRTPVEIKAMQMCQNRPGSDSIAGYLGSSVDAERLSYRIIMPYYSYGSLVDIIDHYRDDTADRYIPEPFVWYAFESLTDACLVMENGTNRKLSRRPKDWSEIVHRDIKPENIFLADPHPENYRSYPQCVLGDFGACIMTSDDDALNPSAYADAMGTRGFLAPEQLALVDSETLNSRLLARQQGWTNVYQIGRTIAALMNKLSAPEGPQWSHGYVDVGDWFTPRAKEEYSEELRTLVQKCVRYLPHKRISATRLKGKIVRRTDGEGGEDEMDYAAGLRRGIVAEGAGYDLRGWSRQDEYAIHSSEDSEESESQHDGNGAGEDDHGDAVPAETAMGERDEESSEYDEEESEDEEDRHGDSVSYEAAGEQFDDDNDLFEVFQ